MEAQLKRRLAELDQAERAAWADLNFVLGRKAEIADLIANLKQSAPEPAGSETCESG